MVPGQHHVRMNMYIAQASNGHFKIVKDLGVVDPTEGNVVDPVDISKKRAAGCSNRRRFGAVLGGGKDRSLVIITQLTPHPIGQLSGAGDHRCHVRFDRDSGAKADMAGVPISAKALNRFAIVARYSSA